MTAKQRVIVTLFFDDAAAAARAVRRSLGKYYRGPGNVLYRDRSRDWYAPAGFIMKQTAVPALCGAAELQETKQETNPMSAGTTETLTQEEVPMSLMTMAKQVKERVAAGLGIETEASRLRAKMLELRAKWEDGAEEQAKETARQASLKLIDLRKRADRGEVAVDGISLRVVLSDAELTYQVAAESVRKIGVAKTEFRDLLPADHPLKVEWRQAQRDRKGALDRIAALDRELQRVCESKGKDEKQLAANPDWPSATRRGVQHRIDEHARTERELTDDRAELEKFRDECTATMERCKAEMLAVEL